MMRAYGSNARLLVSPESSYGVSAQTYVQVPFKRCTLSSEQGLLDDPLLGYGRDPEAPSRDALQDEGEIGIPVDTAYMGLWLFYLLGPAKSAQGEGNLYTHTFASGQTALPSATLEVGLLDLKRFFVHAGVKAGSMSLEWTRSGSASATLALIAQGEEMRETSLAPTPQVLELKRLAQFQGKVTREGKSLSNLTEASLTYNNHLEKIETLRSDGKIEGIDPTAASLTGSLSMRFGEESLMREAMEGAPLALDFTYALPDGPSLTFKASQIHLPKPKLVLEGPLGIQVSFDFQGSKKGETPLLEVSLVNALNGDLYR